MKVAIIGAGPAGIYTALLLEEFKGEVHLYEQNKDIGEKLKTTGGGRMNVTNRVFSENEFSSQQQRWVQRLWKNPHFENRYKILEKLGIEYKWEKNRAILESQDAIAEVARLKTKIINQENIKLHLNTKIQSITKSETGFVVNDTTYDKIILTTGGMYRMGDLGPAAQIYQLQTDLDHTITDVCPSLCALIFKDKPLREFSGISFVGRLTDTQSNQSITDDLLITHFGISGPAALDFSSFAGENVQLSFITKVSENEFLDQFNELRSGKNSIKKFLKQFIPNRLVEFHLQRAQITQDFMSDLPKAQLKTLIQSLFHYPIPPRQQNVYPGSWTTKGGVDVSEVQTKNLESKKVPGVYFAGEVLDCNGLCGGYNISFAMISAQIVADHLMS